MSPYVATVLSCVVAFFLGGIPFGVIFGKYFGNGIDIRSHGSGNMGFTNAARVAGKKIGILTLICDVLKGFVGVTIGVHLITSCLCAQGAHSHIAAPILFEYQDILTYVVWVYLFVVLGHCFTPYLRFKGGKGISVGLGGSLAIFPLVGLSALAAFLVVAFASKKVSLGSLTAAVCIPLFAFLYFRQHAPLSFFSVLCVVSLVVIWAHRTNIANLYKGTERSFGVRK